MEVRYPRALFEAPPLFGLHSWQVYLGVFLGAANYAVGKIFGSASFIESALIVVVWFVVMHRLRDRLPDRRWIEAYIEDSSLPVFLPARREE